MKKNYYLALLVAFLWSNLSTAQFACPETIGPQSTVSTLHFKIVSGTCGDYPSSIFVSEGGLSATYVVATCNGTNLKYDFSSGDTLPSEDTFIVDFPLAGICGYVNGSLITLSNDEFSLNESLSVYPNPLVKQSHLNLKFSRNTSAYLNMYDVTGKLAVRDEISNAVSKKLNTSALNNGIYFLKIATDKASVTRKIIIMN